MFHPAWIKVFLRSNWELIRFLMCFLIFFCIGQFLYYLFYPTLRPIIFQRLTIAPTFFLFQYFSPDRPLIRTANGVQIGEYDVNVLEGCEGTEGILLVLCALAAYRMNGWKKIGGMIVGSLVIYLSNLCRILVLYYTLSDHPDWFDFVHLHAGQTFIIIISLLFFILWINFTLKPDAKPD